MRRYSPVRGRPLTAYEQTVERFAASRAGAWLFLHAISPADRALVPLTRGRLSLAVGAPVGVLETVGARTGRVRRTPLLHAADGDRLVLVASNSGRPRDPGWLHNVRARPDVRFLTRVGGWRAYRAEEATGEQRARLWELATDLFAGYSEYAARAQGREIAVVVLIPDGGA